MKTTGFFLFLIAALLFGYHDTAKSKGTSEGPEIGVQVGYFYSSLSPYGEWIEVEGGLRVWRPLRVRAAWRPYLDGRWVWTDYGWYWVSDEPFGWAVFHYGRWYYDDFYGWVWVPDQQWGPAWVEWRYNDSYIGWAPLPPYASFSITVGIRFTRRWVAPYHYWCFVPHRYFGATVRYRDVVPIEYTRRLIHTTRTSGGYEVDRDRVINRGVDRSFLERRGAPRINRVEIRESGDRRGDQIVREGSVERVEVYRPSRADMERTEKVEARRGERRLSLDMEHIERNDGRDRDGTQRERIAPAPNQRIETRKENRIERQREANPNIDQQKRGRDQRTPLFEQPQRTLPRERRELNSPPRRREFRTPPREPAPSPRGKNT